MGVIITLPSLVSRQTCLRAKNKVTDKMEAKFVWVIHSYMFLGFCKVSS